jgi:hypothetical protein
MRRGDFATLLDRRWIVVLDFKVITTRLLEVNRVGEMSLVRLRHAFDLVLIFVLSEVFVRLGDFPGA